MDRSEIDSLVCNIVQGNDDYAHRDRESLIDLLARHEEALTKITELEERLRILEERAALS